MTETKIQRRPKRRSYDAETIQEGLLELAFWNGNTRQASRSLAERGVEIPKDTLEYWKRKHHVTEYQRIRDEQLPELRARAADRHAAQEDRDLTLSEAAADLLMAKLPYMKDKELIDAKYKADLGSGIHADKRLVYEGQPNNITARRSSDEILRELKSMGVDPKEITVEVVSEEDVKETSA